MHAYRSDMRASAVEHAGVLVAVETTDAVTVASSDRIQRDADEVAIRSSGEVG